MTSMVRSPEQELSECWSFPVPMKLKDTCSLEENYDKPRHHIKKQRHYFADKGLSSQSYGFSSSHI